MNDLIKQVLDLVTNEYSIDFIEDYDLGELPNELYDSFGELEIVGRCEPEDAIWYRDLNTNFHSGLSIGIRNTLKVLKDNPELIKELTEVKS